MNLGRGRLKNHLWRNELELKTKQPDRAIPSYSVKEDVLPYLNCRLQYRYRNGGSLPSARPERFWFGLFIHGTLELAYRFWKSEADPPNLTNFDIGKFANEVEESLRRQGISARNRKERDSAYVRVGTAVNALGCHLFPLIDGVERVEYKVSATRPMPQSGSNAGRESYELRGVLDALARAVPDMGDNLIREYVKKDCPDITRNSELILEYKGARRPARGKSLWIQDELQVQAYAWLRKKQSGKLPAAGIVIYVNELSPRGELDKAIRVIPISPQSVDSAIAQIDDVERQIQDALADEETDGNIIRSWQPNCRDKTVCRDCDFRHFCPSPLGRRRTTRSKPQPPPNSAAAPHSPAAPKVNRARGLGWRTKPVR